VKANAQKSPSFIEPMQALAVEKLPEGDWLYEVKLDGYRALAFKNGKEVRLISRNNKPLN
jgi:bifunctional non-homologous end joining protein LigD